MSDKFISAIEQMDPHSFIVLELKCWNTAGPNLADRLDGFRLGLIDAGFELRSPEVRHKFSGIVEELGFLAQLLDIKRAMAANAALKKLFEPDTEAEKAAADELAAKLDAGQRPF